jgi:hypothetical protein
MSGEHIVLTGPIRGTVTLADGTEVDVRPFQVEAESQEQAVEIAHLVSKRYAEEGHPAHDPDQPFVYDEDNSFKSEEGE